MSIPLANWIKEKQQSAPFFGANSAWLEQYYDLYLQDPQAVTPELQQLFKQFDGEQPDVRHQPVIEQFIAAGQLPAGGGLSGDADHAMKQAAVLRLINSSFDFRISLTTSLAINQALLMNKKLIN